MTFLTDQYSILEDVSKRQQEHNTLCRATLHKFADELAKHWQAQPSAIRVGTLVGSEFESNRLPDADDQQRVACTVEVNMGDGNQLKWGFFVPLTVQRGIHGFTLSIDNGETRFVSDTRGGHNFSGVIYDVENFLAKRVQEQLEKVKLKAS